MMETTLRTPTTRFFEPRLADVSLGPIVAGGRLLDTVAVHDLQGTLDDIALQIEVSSEDLVAALAELTEVGWIALEPGDNGRVRLRLSDDAR